jgi:hypothetical protein
MQRIRSFYRGLTPEAEQFFDPPASDAQFAAAMGTVGLGVSPLRMLFTGASMVAAINSMLGGVVLALLAARVGHLGDAAALLLGVLVAAVLFGLHLVYQQQRSAKAGLHLQGKAPSP